MSLFKKMFSGSDTPAAESGGNGSAATAAPVKRGSKFGRYTDCNKTKQQVEYWNQAVAKFSEKQYVDAFETFLRYLRDEVEDNVKIIRNDDSVEFELIQGSKVIKGKGTAEKFEAESNLAVMESPSVPVMRKLMSINYNLLYSKFALVDNKLCMKFSSHAIDASPNKLYAAIKELAKKADQQDDLLVAEFSVLKPIDTHNIVELSPEMKDIRYNYLRQMIEATKEEIGKHDPDYMSGGIAFLLLNLSYQIDYLIRPQGNLTDSLEKIQHMFFDKNSQASTQERNNMILAEYDKILNAPKEQILEGIYDVTCTFAIANPAAHKTVMDFMFKEREKIGWYRDNNYPQMVEAIYGYMFSYAFFNYGMIYPVTEMMDIAMNMLNEEYYAQCGMPSYSKDGTINSGTVIQEINAIVARAKGDYPYIAFNTATLNFTNVTNFMDSLLTEMDKMDLRK